MTAKVPISDIGTDIAGITVPQSVRRKRRMTPTTRAIVSSNVFCTSATLARIVCVRSDTIWILSDGGSEASSCGSAFLMASTVAMTLAPDWRWTAMMMAGSVFIQPARFTSCGPTMARPTSRTRTGPLTPTTPGLGLMVAEVADMLLDPCAVVAKVPGRLARI